MAVVADTTAPIVVLAVSSGIEVGAFVAKRLGRLDMVSCGLSDMSACGHVYNTAQPHVQCLNFIGGFP